MNVVTVASDTVWRNTDANLKMHAEHVEKVMKKWPKTDVILFPEMSLSGFVVDESNLEIAEVLEDKVLSGIGLIDKKYNVNIIAGLAEKNPSGGRPFNTAFVVNRAGELVTKYHKNHLFTESDEVSTICAGDNLAVFDLEGWKCGLSICFDIRFPELFRTYKKAGVEIMFSLFNWVEGRNKPAIMENLIKSRATENQFFFAAVDRTGSDPNTSYYGTSVISNPYCEDNSERDGIYAYAELDKNDIKTISSILPLEGSYKSDYKLG